MTTDSLNQGPPQRRTTLSHLCRSHDPRRLVRLALDAVQALDAARPGAIPDSRSDFQPRMMLTLLSYCYAVGIYGSRDIERAIQTNPTVRYICAREYPDGPAIRRFRQENRPLLEQCLGYILTQAWALKFDEAEVDFLGFAWFENDLNRQIAREIYDRIEIASFMDLMERED